MYLSTYNYLEGLYTSYEGLGGQSDVSISFFIKEGNPMCSMSLSSLQRDAADNAQQQPKQLVSCVCVCADIIFTSDKERI